ncbi:prepilin-type N-terminal cleavage/methylation domain-containing protein [Acidaminobacter sp. JC074]|nr:prepilin-type N-terminal cleavage/methylation domain-containing protein [Acidaminobacter sp. JC074]
MRKKLNKKGFSLIELIVVIAILAIIAAVAIPRFAGIQDRSTIKADATTAAEIINAARVQHADTGTAVTDGTGVDLPNNALDGDYMVVPDHPQSADDDAYNLTYDGTNYQVTWVVNGGTYDNDTVTVSEGVEFKFDTTTAGQIK